MSESERVPEFWDWRDEEEEEEESEKPLIGVSFFFFFFGCCFVQTHNKFNNLK